MTTDFNRSMRVVHTVEDNKHIVRIYPPASPVEFKIGTWSVSAEDTSLEAIWSGVCEAQDACDIFSADGIAVHSTDKEAFAAYCAEVHRDEY